LCANAGIFERRAGAMIGRWIYTGRKTSPSDPGVFGHRHTSAAADGRRDEFEITPARRADTIIAAD
jgi:hypothetical protein